MRQAGLRDVCDGQRVTRTLPMDTYGPMVMVSTQVVEATFLMLAVSVGFFHPL